MANKSDSALGLEQALFSVVTITRDNPAELQRTSQSVIRQTYPEYEHIVVDGGTIPIPRTPSGFYLRQNGAGIADAFNLGLRNARGRYIIFLNAGDEFADSDTLVAVHHRILNTTSCNVALWYGNCIAKRGTFTKAWIASSSNLLWRNTLCHQAVFFNTEIHKLFPYDTRLKFGMDHDVYLRMQKQYRCEPLQETVAIYYYGGISSVDRVVMDRALSRFMVRLLNGKCGLKTTVRCFLLLVVDCIAELFKPLTGFARRLTLAFRWHQAPS
jgi:glycosyltransferase involved in cell wall biosynthesis